MVSGQAAIPVSRNSPDERKIMAERRMFSRQLIESDGFTDMQASARLLYFHLALRADDDGFVFAVRATLRMAGLPEESIEQLTERGFLIPLDDGIYLIRHWHAHNAIPKSKYTPSQYSHLLSGFKVDKSGAYIKRTVENAECNKAEYDDGTFLIRVAKYFADCSYLSSPDSFIAYNAARGWCGVGGEDIRESYERYSDEWEKNYRLRHGLPMHEEL